MPRIVDQKDYDKNVNSRNKAIIADFLIEKKSEGRSPGTLLQYQNDLKIIAYIIYQHFGNKEFTCLSRKEIRNLSIYFQEQGLSNARVNRLLSALRSTLEYCSNDDDYDYEFNIGSRVKGLPKNPVREITFLTEDQIKWLIEELVARKEYLQAVYLSLSYYSAARKNEVYQVLKEGLADRYYTNIVRGKRNKLFRLYYGEETRQLISLYLEHRGDDDLKELFVKVTKSGEKQVVSKSSFDYWCVKMSRLLSERENKQIHINPHCFRHSRLENLNRQGVPIEKLKSLANHSDISTTASYLADRSEDDIADIFGMDPSFFKTSVIREVISHY
ncbi:tyrosine-type recombinase/integrase [Anoxybacillus sp. LAT_38]|uniref:tyrosine-type recombinase/integrase n=1 Tax=Anoxybacillus sp. LAT_26 TaxID=2862719 RepID=UPI001EEC214B|nr:tyrosine-type recombinase/integrase [Anoxybacillus sp. LAT_26]MCG6182887.1 tyrosine-type recombinase/integrase [Anoxybacillus sp. LAT_26]MCG6199263.1 tyrosine-type recombinase/integrase [Anoxybacillus sp. LAT_38]